MSQRDQPLLQSAALSASFGLSLLCSPWLLFIVWLRLKTRLEKVLIYVRMEAEGSKSKRVGPKYPCWCPRGRSPDTECVWRSLPGRKGEVRLAAAKRKLRVLHFTCVKLVKLIFYLKLQQEANQKATEIKRAWLTFLALSGPASWKQNLMMRRSLQ